MAEDVAGEDAPEEEVASEEAQDEGEEEARGPEPWAWGTGRRKTAVARVRIRPGQGQVVVNRKPIGDYFRTDRLRRRAVEPLKAAKLENRVDVYVNVKGGGTTGQAEAMLMGLARAILKYDETATAALRASGHLTRDSRMVERKKYGRRGARRRFQYSKR